MRVLFQAVIFFSLLIPVCAIAQSEVQNNSMQVVEYAAPKTLQNKLWQQYIKDVVRLNYDDMSVVEIYWLPVKGLANYTENSYKNLINRVRKGDTRKKKNRMIIFISPDSEKLANLIVEAYQDKDSNSSFEQDARFVFVGNPTDSARVAPIANVIAKDYRFVDAKL